MIGTPGLDLAAIPLDEAVRLFNLPSATHLKIDVDGDEDAVLDGAAATLHSPTLKHVLIEVESGRTDLDHVKRMLAGAGLVSVVQHGASETYNWLCQRIGRVACEAGATSGRSFHLPDNDCQVTSTTGIFARIAASSSAVRYARRPRWSRAARNLPRR
jgi:hypothetical protein